MKHSLIPVAPVAVVMPTTVQTMQDVKDALTLKGPAYLLQALRTLETHVNHAPLSTLNADLAWVETNFPKVRKGVHPRPDLNQSLPAYRKWRADLLRAVKITTGFRTAQRQRQARQDGWAELLAAVRLHSRDGGLIQRASAGMIARLADIARRASIEPWELASDDAVARLEKAFHAKDDRPLLGRGLRFLADHSYIPEIARVLPDDPLPRLPTLRARGALPDHVEAVIARMADTAATTRDEVAGEDSRRVSKSTRDRYLAAMRHHLRTLPHCPEEPKLGYERPVRDLGQVNDVAGLFALEHIKATIRRTEAVEHLPGTLSQVSAYHYYKDILVVLSRNGVTDDEVYRQVKTSVFLKDGGELAKGMRPATKDWCSRLLKEPERERRFRNLHRILQAKADRLLEAAKAEGRDPFDPDRGDLTEAELTKVRALGTAAAASAIEWAGRPIRMANVLGLRLYGSRANFSTPGPMRAEYGFFLTAAETKSGKEEPFAPLRKELHGPQVLAWYLRTIRPLFPQAAESIFLFPAVTSAAKPLGKGVFDAWFQRAASEADLPMSFHRWRHGYASIMLAMSWSNLQVAADMLGNTPEVCARSYAWINKEELFLAGQDLMIERSRGRK